MKSQESENLHNSDMVKLMPADRSLYDNLVPFPVSDYGTKGIQHVLSTLQNATLFDLGQFANNDPGVHSLHGDVDSTLLSATIDAVNAVPQSQEILRRGHQLLYDPGSLNPGLGLKNTNNRAAHGNPTFE
ncbi:hypothetical protein FACS189454_05910 [Planctomycetales bacterium]|nr:hypothetical protein FACS189454_05910 [Planctomycetales bacterium]